jgi:hypothetical protein
MVRLAEYMRDLGVLLGEADSVHFERLDPGSTAVISRIKEEAVPKVHHRIRAVRSGEGTPDAMRAFRDINRRLANDNATGEWGIADRDDTIIRFPGVEERVSATFGPFTQESTLDGTLIRVGGREDWVPVHLQSGPTIYSRCQAHRDLATAMAAYIFKSQLRVFGNARWTRDEYGAWVLNKFTIRNFRVLDDSTLSDVVQRLRGVGAGNWDESDDPIGELHRLRADNDKFH